MALINCGECGSKHSENAEICPSCGNPNPASIIKKAYSGLGGFVAWIWLLSSAFLIYVNWNTLDSCLPDINFFGKVAFSGLAPIQQLFGQSDAFPECRQLFDEKWVITLSRVSVGSGLILCFIGWLSTTGSEIDK